MKFTLHQSITTLHDVDGSLHLSLTARKLHIHVL